jgi:hypothetical protein
VRREAMGLAGLQRMKSDLNWEHSLSQLLKAYRTLDHDRRHNI